MSNKIEKVIVENCVRHILRPEIADSENYADSIASMICEEVSMRGIDSDNVANKIKEQVKWERELHPKNLTQKKKPFAQ